MFWFPWSADINSLRVVIGFALLTNASIGMKLEPLAKIGYLASSGYKDQSVQHVCQLIALTLGRQLEVECFSTLHLILSMVH